MKCLCFDYGSKRMGVAVSDPDGRMAFPRGMITKDTRQKFFERIGSLVTQEKPDALVLGLPLRQDGSDSLTTRQVRNFAASLKRRHELPLYLMNERYSSFEAEELLREAGAKGNCKEDGRLDSAAAARILESFLNLSSTQRESILFSIHL